MRVLAIADVHGKRSVYDWLLTSARKHSVEAIVLAGDLLGCPEGFDTPEEAQQSDGQALTQLLQSAVVPVLYIMGNDDLVELNSCSAWIRSIHNRRVTFGAFNFVGYQYSLPFIGGVFEKPEAGIQSDLSAMRCLVDTKTVFVSHTPALGILDPGLCESNIGSGSMRDFLEGISFLVHVHGHSHDGFGRHGKHFNVASAGQMRAMILDLRTLQHQILDAGRSRSEA
jgi:Icc-related predicted phosphoesterase